MLSKYRAGAVMDGGDTGSADEGQGDTQVRQALTSQSQDPPDRSLASRGGAYRDAPL